MTGRGAGALAVAALAILAGCADRARAEREAAAATGGDPHRGRWLVRTYGSGAGRLAHTPANLVRWIRAPREVDPQTAMPNMGVGEQDARDLAAVPRDAAVIRRGERRTRTPAATHVP